MMKEKRSYIANLAFDPIQRRGITADEVVLRDLLRLRLHRYHIRNNVVGSTIAGGGCCCC